MLKMAPWQLWSTWNGIVGTHDVREAFLLVVRLGGPLVTSHARRETHEPSRRGRDRQLIRLRGLSGGHLSQCLVVDLSSGLLKEQCCNLEGADLYTRAISDLLCDLVQAA